MQLRLSTTVVASAVVLLAGAACAPALDWRDIRIEGTVLVAQLPCKPSVHERKVVLAGQPMTMTLKTCTAANATWALACVKGLQPAQVTDALRHWREAAAGNVRAPTGALRDMSIPGATPNPLSGRTRVLGQRQDGTAVTQELVLFVHGTTLFQATVLSSAPDTRAVEHFFAELRLRS